jgi:hypothetical protein
MFLSCRDSLGKRSWRDTFTDDGGIDYNLKVSIDHSNLVFARFVGVSLIAHPFDSKVRQGFIESLGILSNQESQTVERLVWDVREVDHFLRPGTGRSNISDGCAFGFVPGSAKGHPIGLELVIEQNRM